MGGTPRILIVRFSAIGDCVMTAWAVTAIRNKFPSGCIEWAVEKRCESVLDTDRLVDSVHVFDRKKGKPSMGKFRKLLRSYIGLHKGQFDWGIDFQGHTKTALALRIAKPRQRLALRCTDFFSARLNPVFKPRRPELHMIEENHLALAQFGEFALPERPIMPSGKAEDGSARYDALIAVGAGHPGKVWPLERWEAVAKELVEKGNKVAFIGGAGDPHPHSGVGNDLVGRASLAESMATIARARCILAGDTGAGHIAAAYGVPVVSIFGPTSPDRYRPWSDSTKILQRGSSVMGVSVEEVVEAADVALESAGQL